MEPPALYRFGSFRLDPRTLELWRDSAPVPLEPLPTRILIRLIERAGELVPRQELRELGWPRLPGAAQQSLNTCMKQIRDALGDAAGEPRYIETLRGRGYRFIEPVVVDNGGSAPAKDSVIRIGWPLSAVAVATLLVVAMAVVADSPDRQPARIVVEPAVVLSDGSTTAVLGEALTEEVRAALAVVVPDRLEVFGRATAVRLAGDSVGDVRGSRSAFGATHALSLSVRTVDNRTVRIVASLTNAVDGRMVWGGTADADPTTLAQAASQLTLAMVESLGLAPGRAPPAVALKLEERHGLLKAHHLFENHRERPALAVLDSLLERSPNVAAAHGLRAEILLVLGDTEGATEAADRALRINAAEPGALRALAGAQMLTGRWEEAEVSLRRALEAAPNDAATLNAFAFLHSVQGRFREAAGALRHAARIDPLSPAIRADAGLMHLWAGRYDEAQQACAETLQLDPDATWAAGCIFDARLRAGLDPTEAGRWILAILGADGAAPEVLAPDGIVEEVRTARVRYWERAFATGADGFPLAAAYADAGRTDDALTVLERVERPTLALLTAAVDPRFSAVAGDPRFRTFLERLNLSVSRSG